VGIFRVIERRRAVRRSLVLCLLLAMAPGCGSCGKPSSGAAVEVKVTVMHPVPAPPGLVAQSWVRAPDALWSRVQNGVSGAAALMPPDVGSLLCAATGLDGAVGPLVDGKADAYVVVANADAGGGAGLAWAAALPLRDGPRVASLLLPGDAGVARYAARDEQGMLALTRLDHPLPVAMALADDGTKTYLVVARSDADLARLGPYAYRSMPVLPHPAETSAVVAQLMPGALAAYASSSWNDARTWLADRDAEQRAKHGGRAPDFGDPQAILDSVDVVVKRRLGLLADAKTATVEIEAGDGDVSADLRLEPQDADAAAAIMSGDTRPLADVPADAVLAVLVRDSAPARADDARELETAIGKALGSRAHADDDRAIASALDAWSAGRGDWLTASLAWGPATAVVVRSPGGEAAVRALRGLMDLGGRPVFAQPLHATFGLGAPSVAVAKVDGLTQASLATFGSKSPLGVAWGLRDDRLVAVAAEHADVRLASLASSPRLGDDPRVARALSALGSDASFVVLAEPLRIDASRAASDAARSPALVAWGRSGGKAWLRLDLGDELLREGVRLQAGL
jgi:hypothetical protein